MTPEKLDLIFPFIMFGYGSLMTMVLSTPFFAELAETRLPYSVSQQIKAHRGLALFCMIAGAFWSMQNIWL